mmetsp:Transcript_3192/g.9608  ORF Transcript_3192/g.9608 Transcript_3192/m.9608 type:complete len:298 (-) Transcript_3192:80-973(-)
MSRMPAMHMYIVRGMGVAESVRTSTVLAACLIFSFCLTPKRCSSSTTNSPSSLYTTLFESSACVPTITFTAPDVMSSRTCCSSPGRRLTIEAMSSMRISGIRARSTRRCCAASTVVGARNATCFPAATIRNTARIATSVLPKPTSPQTSRSIGRSEWHMSCSISAKQRTWSAVGSNWKLEAKAAKGSPSGAHGLRCNSCRSAYSVSSSDATFITFFAAFDFRFCHVLRERSPSSRTVSNSPTSSLRLYSLISPLLASGTSSLPSLNLTLSAFSGTHVPSAFCTLCRIWCSPSNCPIP